MALVGLTGGIGSGKSTAAQIFSELGVPVIDTDIIAHSLTAPGQATLAKIIDQFGTNYLQSDQTLNRAALREHVFANGTARKALETILHPAIHAVVLEEIAQQPQAPYQVIVVPLLFETEHYLPLITRSLVIDCEEELQASRAARRGRLSREMIAAIMRAQLPREERIRRADDVISNNGSQDELRGRIEALHARYMLGLHS